MLNTKQVRGIMQKHGKRSCYIYTNKVKSAGDTRHVKCYYGNNDALAAELRAKAGQENVKITKGTEWGGRGLIVTCKKA